MKLLSLRNIALCVVALLVISCGQKNELSYNEDIYVLEDTLVSAEVNYLTFESTNLKQDEWLRQVTDSFDVHVKAQIDTLMNDSKQFRESVPLPEGYPPYEFFVQDTLYVISNKLISYRYTQYVMQGGAHGMTSFISYNLVPDKMLSLQPADIIKKDELSIDSVNKLLQKNFDTKDCFFVMPNLEEVSAVNITPDGLLFTYAQYVLGPYACGVAEIFIPKKEAMDYLEPVVVDYFNSVN